MVAIKPGSADWNLLEDLLDRHGLAAVQDAVDLLAEDDEDENGDEDEFDDDTDDADDEEDEEEDYV